MKPGEIICGNDFVVLNEGLETRQMEVTNRGSRPIQIGSHFHFFEANRFLKFERKHAYGFRLDIASGTAVRFEPDETRKVRLVRIAGKQIVKGFNNLSDGLSGDSNLDQAMNRARLNGFE